MTRRRQHDDLGDSYRWISPRQALIAPLPGDEPRSGRGGSGVAHFGAPKLLVATISGAAAILLMIGALWAWREGVDLVQFTNVSQPLIVKWAMRCGGIGAASVAQALLLTFVMGSLFRRDVITDMLRVLAVVVFLLSMAAAVSLVLAGR